MRPIEILLVEDNPGDIDLTREAMLESKLKNNLHVVMDGKEALDFLYKRGSHEASNRPDLILLDLNLPHIDGREVLKQVKADPDLRRIPVIILTSSKSENDVIETYNLHTNAYIKKPINFNEFIDTVKRIEAFWLSVVIFPPDEL